ncbi:N(4)-(beta-N-acetylglucosaminyl)-L-asparaginase [Lancefieldella sp. Marseille-Q7238]|uniref:N(4)-(beta-N-acetylglucosaminyl)-L-asparaginase n=1 Tax=Lancefieldella sp. Marseille-Q7238 TaxID=3022127 RepID=UPI0024A96F25|nr:N(4)-(beta-N-acetylglucosaminyl)-L-asparaginase [Lancefieldella sp. Marseille-Q7238]
MWGIIATWRMALEGVSGAACMLAEGESAGDAVEAAVRKVEDFPYYKSVGFGGLPNAEGDVELDAGFMDGDTLAFGSVGALKDFANPVSIARALSQTTANCVLMGEGAEKYAARQGFERKTMLTDRARIRYMNRLKTDGGTAIHTDLKPYAGHDTVGMVCLDAKGTIASATSTSGLFMKRPGRIGDSPICGAGLYADSCRGGATVTGLGEDCMRGCISYEVVRLMGEGLRPQEACEQAVAALDEKLRRVRGSAGDLSIVAMNAQGAWGAATNIDGFSFVVATEELAPVVYVAERQGSHTVYQPATKAWLDEYMTARTAPVELI